ncbi:MAG: hypothetical protein ABI408_07255 [Gemmatimonadaceae bacterium]
MDTSAESPIYPVGDAIPVYRAVLDLLYLDGNQRPPIIVMHDSVVGRMGSTGPCPFTKCVESSWYHKSKMDTATVMSFARLNRRQPLIREFGYPIPIVFISFDDVQRMEADGQEFMAAHPQPKYANQYRGFWIEFHHKYPRAWGVTYITKVGFNPRHTEALVQLRQWCGDECRSDEILFLQQTAGRWRVVERIPSESQTGQPFGDVRYVGPTGSNPKESEIIPAGRPLALTDASARAAVYRSVLDSLYSFQGEHPKRIVLSDGFRLTYTLQAHTSPIDTELVKSFGMLGPSRAPLDTRPKYRIPIAVLPADSVSAFTVNGVTLDPRARPNASSWRSFTKRYPFAWGILTLGRVAFNPARTQALVNTTHVCGESCLNLDTWFLERTGNAWRIVERIPGQTDPTRQLDALRYLGVDAKPNAYSPRRVQGVLTDEQTTLPLAFYPMRITRMLPSGGHTVAPSISTDSSGHYSFTNLPLMNWFSLLVGCPKAPQHPVFSAPFAVSEGLDSTMDFAVNFVECDFPSPYDGLMTLSGAQAFIWPDSAQFVFPRQATDSYSWDLPTPGMKAGVAEFAWDIRWEIPDAGYGVAPSMISLIKRWNTGGSQKGSLAELIAAQRLQAMIDCLSCEHDSVADVRTDQASLGASVENGQLTFVVRGAETVRHLFPTTPRTVTFMEIVRQDPGGRDPRPVRAWQMITVNCRSADRLPDGQHRCDARQ